MLKKLQGQERGRPAGHPGKRVGGRGQHVPRRQERHAQSRGGGKDKRGSQVWILIHAKIYGSIC